MDPTVVVAIAGLIATVVAAALTAHMHNRTERASRLFQARVAAYSQLATTLYEYERATYDRVKSRLDGRGSHDRDAFRQDAYTSNAAAKSSIGVVGLLSGVEGIFKDFDQLRQDITEFNSSGNATQLKARHDAVIKRMAEVFDTARKDLND